MVGENQRLPLKPGLSYFGAGQRTAAHEASEHACPVIQSKLTPSGLKHPLSWKFYFGSNTPSEKCVSVCAPAAIILSKEEHKAASLKHGLIIQNP